VDRRTSLSTTISVVSAGMQTEMFYSSLADT